VEPELVRLAVTIGEKIIAQELELRPEMVVNLVRNAMRRVRDREALRVSVNPHDLEQVRAAREDLISAVDGIKKLEVIEDRRVDRGGCIIESQNGTLDARISTQMEEINRALEGVMPNGESNDAEAGSQPLAGLKPVPAGDRPD
jgi:flagellar assembly protein FliH